MFMFFQKKYLIYLLIFAIQLFSCVDKNKNLSPQKNIGILEEAQTIQLEEGRGRLIYHSGVSSQDLDRSQLPFKRFVLFSASAVGYFEALQSLDAITGIYGSDWVYSPTVQQKIAKGEIKNMGKAANANIEQILAQKPDAVIAFTEPNQSPLLKRIEEMGISVIIMDEYKEKTPLGKAEFIKLIGRLCGKSQEADLLFDEIKQNYNDLKALVSKINKRPTVFAGILYGDIWYLPGGDSFVAAYLEDAGSDYLWADDKNAESIHLDFESVLDKGQNADYWVNAGDFKNLSQLNTAYKNYHWFAAVKNKEVYSLSKRVNEKGANDYFESGSVRADWVLADLIAIFHPILLPNHQMKYYIHLE